MQSFWERANRGLINAAFVIPLVNRFAPDLLGYVLTYTGYLKKETEAAGGSEGRSK